MNSRCNICLDKDCEKKMCNCDGCKNKDICNKKLRPTIRITTKCTQACSHCCFNCSPKRDDFMTIKTAEDINKFMISNNIEDANIMGGEFTENPDWYDVLSYLVKNLKSVRLVSNGDWAGKLELSNQVVEFMLKNPNVKLSISNDKWHTCKYVVEASKICEDNNIEFNIATEKETKEDSIVPVGRGELFSGLYSFFACYCQNPEHKYSFLIDETGEIYKCSFGVLNYSDIYKHLDGGFDKVFKQFNKKFYSCFITNCASCARTFQNKSVKDNLY